MKVIFTNKWDFVSLSPAEDGYTIEILDDPRCFHRGSYVSFSEPTDLTDEGGGGNTPDSSGVISPDPQDCVTFNGNVMNLAGVVVFKIFVFRKNSYICYCLVEDINKRRKLLEDMKNYFESPEPTTSTYSLNRQPRTLTANPLETQPQVILPGLDSGDFSVQSIIYNDDGE